MALKESIKWKYYFEQMIYYQSLRTKYQKEEMKYYNKCSSIVMRCDSESLDEIIRYLNALKNKNKIKS